MKERLFSWRPFRGATSEKEAARAHNDEPRARRVAEKTNLSVALACDWLTTPGGAEKVLLELHRMYPAAPIYTSQYRKKGINWFDDAEVRTGWLQIFPKSLRKFLGPLRQLYFSRLDLTSYDLVISVTGAEAKSLKARTHLCYCHVPTQYYWQMYDKYLENPGFGFLNPLVRLCFKLLVGPLRKADYAAAQRPTQFITISDYASAQIKKYYDREAVIIAPPVDIHKFSTRNPQPSLDFSTETIKKSTENTQISTENRELSTSLPQEIHNPTSTFPLSAIQNNLAAPENAHNNAPESTPEDPPMSAQCPPNVHPMSIRSSSKSPEIIPKSASKQAPAVLPRVSIRPETVKKSAAIRALASVTPSVNLEAPTDLKSTEPPFVISCRQVTWKRVDLAISACLKTRKPLLVIGDGPEHKNLVKLANGSPLITFIPWLETSELAAHLQTAEAYLFPSLEPFGIAAVEALAAGCPVIAYAEGGSRDFVHESGPGKNGLLFPEQTVDSLAAAIQSFDPSAFDSATVRQSAEKFAPDVFRQKITTLVDKVLTETLDETLEKAPAKTLKGESNL